MISREFQEVIYIICIHFHFFLANSHIFSPVYWSLSLFLSLLSQFAWQTLWNALVKKKKKQKTGRKVKDLSRYGEEKNNIIIITLLKCDSVLELTNEQNRN